MIGRRRALITAALATPFIRRARAAERGLTIAAFGDIFQEHYETAVVEPFRRLRPNLDIYYYVISNSTEGLSLLRMQRILPEIDVILLDAISAAAATRDGLLAAATPDDIPPLRQLPNTAFIPGVAGPVLYYDNLVVLFAPNQIRTPNSWKILWDAALEKKIAIAAPPDLIGISFTLIANRVFGGGDYHRSVADGMNAIAEMAPRVLTWDPRPDIYDFMLDGTVSLGVGWNGQGQTRALRSSGRVAVAIPEEGSLCQAITMNLVKGSDNPYNAKTFLAYAAGVEAQKAFAERMFFTPVNPAVRLTPYAQERTVFAPDRMARMLPMDWAAVGEMRPAITAQWRSRILRRR